MNQDNEYLLLDNMDERSDSHYGSEIWYIIPILQTKYEHTAQSLTRWPKGAPTTTTHFISRLT
jgi:hypothetical protein